MAAAAQQQPNIGEHPFTGELVSTLRRADGGLMFTSADIERFRDDGAQLPPVTLLSWLRDLSILAVTLRDDMRAPVAASQIERGLIDPLTGVLDNYITSRGVADARVQSAKAASETERKKLSDNRIIGALPQSKSIGITMIRPRGKRGDS